MRDEKAILQLCDGVRQTAYELHTYLRSSYLEKVYENGLAHRLRKEGLRIEQQFGLMNTLPRHSITFTPHASAMLYS